MYFERYEAADFVHQTATTQETGSSKLEAPGPAGGNDSGGATGISGLPILGQPQSTGPGLELDQPAEGRDFGSRMHQLLDERRRGLMGQAVSPLAEWPDEAIESEAQATLAAYEAHYVRDYEYLESERTHVLPLPVICPACGSGKSEPVHCADGLETGRHRCLNCREEYSQHELVVKLDAVVRHADRTIGPMDTKTESRPGYNTREDWAGKTQAKIYLWALEKLYPTERVSRLVVDVVSRGSPKAQRGPVFTRLDDINSTPQALQEAIRNVIWVAHDIEQSRKRNWWRSNMNLCKKGWERCDFYPLHVIGRTVKNLRKYRVAEQYLDL